MTDTRTDAELEQWKLHCWHMLQQRLSHVERRNYAAQYQRAIDELRRRKYDRNIEDLGA